MIIKRPDPRLSYDCDEVKHAEAIKIGNKLRQDWTEYQKQHPDFRVVGLAAPQIGITKRVFVAWGEVFINPKIIHSIEESTKFHEGCCSLGDSDFRDVERSLEVSLLWTDVSRRFHKQVFYDHNAAIIQHEMDHLDGVMIDDRAPLPKMSQKNKAKVKA